MIGVGCLILTELIVESMTHDQSYYQAHGWPKLLAFWIAAALVFVLSRWLDRQPGRAMIDKATGQEVVIKKRHALFFIPVRSWPYIFLVLGLIFLFVKE
jgi:hypothetical protein